MSDDIPIPVVIRIDDCCFLCDDATPANWHVAIDRSIKRAMEKLQEHLKDIAIIQDDLGNWKGFECKLCPEPNHFRLSLVTDHMSQHTSAPNEGAA